MDFDGALNKSGGFGRFQKIMALVFLVTATAHFTSNHMSQVFLLIVPEHYWCSAAVLEGNTSFAKSDSTGNDSLVVVKQSCLLERGFGAIDTNGTATERCPQGWHYDYGDLYPTMSTEHNWVCADSWKQYILHTTFWIGSMCGYVTSGFLADRFGRRLTILVLCLVGVLGNLMPLFIAHHWGLAVCRLIAGMGAETVCSTIFVLVMEFTIPERRTLIGFVWALSWTLMASAYPWYANLLQSWRGLVVTNSALSAFILVILWFVPESASWLLTTGQRDRAVATLINIAKVNGLHQIGEDDFKALQFTRRATDASGNKRSFLKDTLALVATPRLRKNTLVLFAGWFLICLCYNANTLELSHLGLNVYGTYSIAIAFELPVNIFTIMALDRLGRRWPNVAFMFVGGTVSLIMAFLRTDSPGATLAMAVITIVCYAGGYNITYQLASEIFPTEIRGRGVLLKRLFGDIGSCLGADVAYLVEYDRYLPILVLGVLSLLAALLLFFVPDTVHEPLPQTISDGENFAKNQALCFCPILAHRIPPEPQKTSGKPDDEGEKSPGCNDTTQF